MSPDVEQESDGKVESLTQNYVGPIENDFIDGFIVGSPNFLILIPVRTFICGLTSGFRISSDELNHLIELCCSLTCIDLPVWFFPWIAELFNIC